ncbi:hypothetical protein H6F76_28210 [Leptolyngbya sp. FACHB-321]|nr:hypothetical protein [Leptolyngbya sp. FACHB-321]MBD2038840.1 hypothetical protein [Leptolyngbya sp. FACHB-321]
MTWSAINSKASLSGVRGQWEGESPVQHQAALTNGLATQPSARGLHLPQH